MTSCWQDLRSGLRALGRSPAFTALAVATLAIGIGATVVIVSFADAAVLNLLQYRDTLGIMSVKRVAPDGEHRLALLQTYEHWRDESDIFTEMAAVSFNPANLTGVDDPEPLSGSRITASLLPMLGVEPRAGRAFIPPDEQPGAPPVAMISERLWRRRYGADPAVIGNNIQFDGKLHTLVGVMPPGANCNCPLSGYVDFWLPMVPDAPDRSSETGFSPNNVTVYGRLRSGLSEEQAANELSRLSAPLDASHRVDRSAWKVHVAPFYKQVIDSRGSMFGLYFAAALGVLLIACLNVGLMMLARGTRRQREFAVRKAVGAGRGRLVRELLTESLLLALLGGAAGVAFAYALLPIVVSGAPANMQRAGVEFMTISPFTLVCTLLVSVMAALIFGLAPALRGSKLDIQTALKHSAGGGGFDRGGRRIQNSLVAIAVGASLCLLIVAGLLGTSFVRAFQIDPGFNREQVLTARMPPPEYKYTDKGARDEFYRNVIDRILALPGVRSAATATPLPLGNLDATTRFLREGETAASPSDMHVARFSVVTPGLFETLGVPLMTGRAFERSDTAEAPPVVMINQDAARQFWPGENPLGKRIHTDQDRKDPMVTVIGVVGDIRYRNLTEDVKPILYRPTSQSGFGTFGMTLLVRCDGDPLALVPAVRKELSAIEPEAPLAEIRTMERVVDDSLSGRRYVVAVVSFFAAIALLLALVGIYGVVSYTVAQRTQEIGLRMALGAQRADAFWFILRRVGQVVVAGLVLGLAASWTLAGLLEKQLYEVEGTNPWVLSGAAVVLLAGALLAASIPARRAMTVEPITALRYD